MINIGFVGDVFPGGCWALKDGLSNEILNFFCEFDLRVANLETAFGDGKVQCHVKMSNPKLGNTLFAPDHCIEILKKLNINVVSLANNHACDCDLQGLAHTIELLDSEGIKHFGAGRNKKEAETPAIITIKGVKIGFLGYFPPEWEAPYPPTDNLGGLNHYYIDKVLSDVKQLKKQCDYVFVMPHWGWEYTTCPRLRDVVDAKVIIEAGADGVFGAHTHTVQPIFKYKNGIIATSLGNFIFPDRYLNPPRQTYYPKKEEIEDKNIPFTDKFVITDKLTLHGMPQKSRYGLICSVKIYDEKKEFNANYTFMTSNNALVFKNLKMIHNLKVWIIKLLISRESNFYYRAFYKMRYYYHRILDKLKIQHTL